MEGEVWTSTWAESSGRRVLDAPRGAGLTGRGPDESDTAGQTLRSMCFGTLAGWDAVTFTALPGLLWEALCVASPLPCHPHCAPHPAYTPGVPWAHPIRNAPTLSFMNLFQFSARLPPCSCDGAHEAVAEAHVPPPSGGLPRAWSPPEGARAHTPEAPCLASLPPRDVYRGLAVSDVGLVGRN